MSRSHDVPSKTDGQDHADLPPDGVEGGIGARGLPDDVMEQVSV